MTLQLKKTTEEARKTLTADLSQEWNAVVPSLDEIKKEAGDLSSDLSLAMEINFKDILGRSKAGDLLTFAGHTLETKGEKHLGSSFGSVEEQLYQENFNAGAELMNKYASHLSCLTLKVPEHVISNLLQQYPRPSFCF